MKARILVAAASLLIAACGGAEVTGAGPVATTPSTVAPVPPATTALTTTTTTTPPGWDPAAAQGLYDEIAERNGWAIPAVALPDFVADACGRELWDPTQAFAFGEALLFDGYLDWRSSSYDRDIRTRAARMGWALAATHCPERFPDAALQAGPPTLGDYPPCDRLSWQPFGLPWTAEVRTADEVTTGADGTLELAWEGPAGEQLTVTFGRGDAWERTIAAGAAVDDFGAARLGPIRRDGRRAHAIIGETVSVGWEGGPEFCDAIVATLSPAPLDDPLDVMSDLLLEPLNVRVNDAELRMWTATLLLRGFDHIGGEPSHGGGDAVHWMVDAAGTGYFLYAIPVEEFPSLRRDGTWAEAGRGEAAGHQVALLGPPSGAGLTARTVVDGFVLEATADLEAGALLDFMATWITAWQAAG